MKGILEFSLPEDNSDWKMHQNAFAMSVAIYDFTNELRTKYKHSDIPPKSWEEVYTMWWDVLKANNLDPYGD